MSAQQIARVSRKAVPADQIALEPNALVILDVVIVSVAEAEAVSRKAVLVVNHLGVVALPSDFAGGLDLVGTVLAGADILSLSIANPDSNVLPVVG